MQQAYKAFEESRLQTVNVRFLPHCSSCKIWLVDLGKKTYFVITGLLRKTHVVVYYNIKWVITEKETQQQHKVGFCWKAMWCCCAIILTQHHTFWKNSYVSKSNVYFEGCGLPFSLSWFLGLLCVNIIS